MEEVMSFAPSATAIPNYLAGTWKADPLGSEVSFSVRMLMLTTVRGRFTGHDVTIVTGESALDSSVAATIDLSSVDTGIQRRDNHLRSADFLEVEKYPTMGYRSGGIRPTDEGWIVDGELTLHGVTRRVPLAVEVNGFGPDPSGGHRAAFSATAQISRGDFGIDRWAGGGAVVGDKVSVSLRIEAVLES
jgi:polyisoprenoid-binding protein YceI